MPAAHQKAPTKTLRSKSTRSTETESGAGRKASTSTSDAASLSASAPLKPAFAKLFQNGRSQAVRLPKEFRFEGKEVQVSRQGKSVVLTPIEVRNTQQYWDDLFRSLDEFRDIDFPECEDDSVTEPEDIFPEGW